MEFYLASTSHLEDRLWFRDDEDFKIGMNYVAVIAHLTGTPVLAFILMSNHVHFVLQGSHAKAEDFVLLFKQRYSAYIQHRYGIREMLRRNDVDLTPVGGEAESLEKAIAYVMMNSVAANICAHPSQYPWGTGSLIFNQQSIQGKSLMDMSGRSCQRMLRSHVELPGNFRCSDTGYILPDSYVNIPFLESLFRTPKRLNWFLFNSSKAKARLAQTDVSLPSFRDQSLCAAIQDLCNSLFRKNAFQELSKEQKAQLVKELRRRFSSDPAQIARVAGISYEETTQFLESF